MTTRLNIKNCKAAMYEGDGRSRFFIWDDQLKGFGLRVYPSGNKSFVLSYRIAGRKRLHTIGRLGLFTPELARKEAHRLLVLAQQGIDPRQAKKNLTARKPTFADLKREYSTRHAPNKKSGQDDLRLLRNYIPGSWRSRELDSFSRQDVDQLHQSIGDGSGPYLANRLLALLRSMFNLAVEWSLLPESHPNPCLRIRMFPEKKRERFLTPEELPKIWKAIQDEKNPYFKAFFTLCLLTGVRRSELQSMKWEDLDLINATWHIPTTKAGRSHLLPLPLSAVETIKGTPRLLDSPWVFPSNSKTGHLVEPKSAWARIKERAGVSDIRIHDLRRTLGSWMAAQGESLLMIGKVLNHTQPSTTAVYARLHLDPVRLAMEKNAQLMIQTSQE